MSYQKVQGYRDWCPISKKNNLAELEGET